MSADRPLNPECCAAVCELLGLEGFSPFGMLVPRERHLALATLLRDHGFTLYVTVAASHWPSQPAAKTAPATEERFEVATVLRHPARKSAENPAGSMTFSWRVALAPGESIDSLALLFAGADWQEREQYDLVGVRFAGHPDLRRLMMDEDWPGHPLRRDYAIDTPHAPWR